MLIISDAVPWPYKMFVAPVALLFVSIFVLLFGVLLIGKRLKLRIPFCSFEISSHPTDHNVQRSFIEEVETRQSIEAVHNQSSNDSKDTQQSPKETPKEIVALFKRFKEIEMSENGSGDSDISPVSVNKGNTSCARLSSGGSQVHVHLHIPKFANDDNNASCKIKDTDSFIQLSGTEDIGDGEMMNTKEKKLVNTPGGDCSNDVEINDKLDE